MSTIAEQIENLKEVIERYDSEEHRYVERFAECPNGCEFDNEQPPRQIGGEREPSGAWAHCNGQSVIEGDPEGTDRCFYGSVENEDAPWVDPVIAKLRETLETLEELADANEDA